MHTRVGVHMHSCRRILLICTVQSLYYIRVYHRCFFNTCMRVWWGIWSRVFFLVCSWWAGACCWHGRLCFDRGRGRGFVLHVCLFLQLLGWWHTFHVDAVIKFLHVTKTMMMTLKERQLDRLKRKSKSAAKEAPTYVVPMHAPQTSPLWHGVGEVSSACEVGCWRKVQPRPFWKLAKGWVISNVEARSHL